MEKTQAYIDGVKLYNKELYAQAAAKFSFGAASGSLLGRLCRLMLSRCYWRNAWMSFSDLKVAKAAENLSSAMVLAGHSMEMSRYFSRFYSGYASDGVSEMPNVSSETKKGSDAIDMLLDAYDNLRNIPTRAEFEMVSALGYQRQEKYSQAREHYLLAAKLAPLDAEPLQKIGQCWAEDGEFGKATEYLSKALALDPADLEITRELFAAAANAGAEAVKSVARPENAGKCDNISVNILANVQLSQEDFVSSFLDLPSSALDEEIFSMVGKFMAIVTEKCPKYPDMHLKTSEVMLRLGDKDAAIESAHRAVRINPHYVQAHYRLGSMLMDIDPRRAAHHLACAVQSGGDRLDIRCELGAAVRQMASIDSEMPHDIEQLSKMGADDFE